MKTFLLKRKINNVFEFYKSTIAINFAVSVLGFFFGGFSTFFVSILFFGFISSIFFKEAYRKNDYIFYFNNGISKKQLLFYSFLMNLIISSFLILIIKSLFH